MVWKTTDGFHVPQQSYPHFGTEKFRCWKIFVRVIFVVVGHWRNIFNDENFLIYGSLITIYVATTKFNVLLLSRSEEGPRTETLYMYVDVSLLNNNTLNLVLKLHKVSRTKD